MNISTKKNSIFFLFILLAVFPFFIFKIYPSQNFKDLQNEWIYSHAFEVGYISEFEAKALSSTQNWFQNALHKVSSRINTPRGKIEIFILFCFVCCVLQSLLALVIPLRVFKIWNTKKNSLKNTFYQIYSKPSKPLSFISPPHVVPCTPPQSFSERDIIKVGDTIYEFVLLKKFRNFNKPSFLSTEKLSLKKVFFNIEKSLSKTIKEQNTHFLVQGDDIFLNCREGTAYYILYVILKNLLKKTLPSTTFRITLKKEAASSLILIETKSSLPQDNIINLCPVNRNLDEFLENAQKNIQGIGHLIGWKIFYKCQGKFNEVRIYIKYSCNKEAGFT